MSFQSRAVEMLVNKVNDCLVNSMRMENISVIRDADRNLVHLNFFGLLLWDASLWKLSSTGRDLLLC